MSDIIIKDEHEKTISDWREWVRPKQPVKHWKPGRSAMECARAWFTSPVPLVPPEIRVLLDSHDETHGLHVLSGQPEQVTQLPRRGLGRNHDLALVGVVDKKLVTLCIEAKADEEFGDDTIGGYYSKKKGTGSGVPERIEALFDILYHPGRSPTSPPWATIRYQLLTAAVGTILQAVEDNAKLAVLIIHEFHTSETKHKKLQKNADDYAAFIEALFGVAAAGVTHNRLYGPHQAVGLDVKLLVGKAIYVWQ